MDQLTGRARGWSRGLNLLLRASALFAMFSTSAKSRSRSMAAARRASELAQVASAAANTLIHGSKSVGANQIVQMSD